ncbi:peptidoglycan-binding protein [Streptomyces xiangluensis]|uniref:Peptidoglycan-binding protein n=1 Tax=Streptomyces xiangluensis TaxID=2665720 RepID=A0ABV8YKL9_9ACTN
MTGEQFLALPENQSPPTGRRGRGRKRRAKKITAAVFVLATAGAVTVAALGLGGESDSGGPAASELPPKTAEILRQTLKDTQSKDGELGHGTAKTVSGRLPGTLTRMPKPGTKITRGDELYAVNNQPVMVMYGALPAYRPLKEKDKGPDVKQLEANLAALGYTGFTVDEEYSDLTAKAVKRWQEDHGLKKTGTVELGRVIFTPGAVRVDSTEAATGDVTGPDQKLLACTGTDKAVTLELDPDDHQLAKKGRPVAIRLPDGSTVNGKISDVTTVLKPGEGDQAPQTKINVVVALADAKARKAADAYDGQAGVHVEFTSGERENVLTVPVSALVALPGGGFGVEVVDGKTTKQVAVTTGLFADGRVEISGDGIAEGTRIGMPK